MSRGRSQTLASSCPRFLIESLILIVATPCQETGSDSLAWSASCLLSELLVQQIDPGSRPDHEALSGYSTVAVGHVLSSASPSMLSLESFDSQHQHQALLLPLRVLPLQELHAPGLIPVHQHNLQHDLLNFDSNERDQCRCYQVLAPRPSAKRSMCPISNGLAAVT